MIHIVDYAYDEKILDTVAKWNYGTNWPVVYIYYNNSEAYVGETLDAVRRTEQHKADVKFEGFTNICLITDKTFNKSVILDLESFLIKYLSADGSKKLINGNAGVSDHNYFYKEAYEDDFKEIWSELKEKKIVSKTLADIENSELFKYSPYKTLNAEQQHTATKILTLLKEINNASKKSLIQVVGGAGTGKTILAVYLVKLLADLNAQNKVWKTVEDQQDADLLEELAKKLSGIKEIGFVVPMIELRNTMKRIFKSIEGLSPDMIYAPEEVVSKEKFFDILIVDEAHRLYQNKHLPQGARAKFKMVNEKLMGKDYKNSSTDLTELDWIIKSSRMQVLFYDARQAIRTPDIDKDRFTLICEPHLYDYIELSSQMRCKGGNGYYDYVKKILEGENLTEHDYKEIKNYTVSVINDFSKIVEFVNKENTDGQGLFKIVAGPAWSMNEDITIDGEIYHWAGTSGANNIIYSIHKVQGFDLNFAVVVFGTEIYYNKETKRIEINKKNLKDNHTKSSGDEKMRDYVLDIYLTLMTRGIYGTYIYAMNPALRDYFKYYFS